MPRLGDVALVTGGAGQIGRAIASALLSAGMKVALCDIQPTSRWSDEAQEFLAANDKRVSTHLLDVTETESCDAVAREVARRQGRINVLVNNAGVMVRKTVLATSDDDWDWVLDVNLGGAFKMCRAVHAHLVRSPKPAVVNVASTHALRPASDVAAYAVSKAGMVHLTRILALEWAVDGIRVNAIAPSIVATDMTADLRRKPGEFEKRVSRIPLGRSVSAENVAQGVRFLACDEASLVTGDVLVVDGGELVGQATLNAPAVDSAGGA